MDPNILKQLGLDSSLSGNDTLLLQKVFSGMTDGKKVKMTPQERNNLMSKLSNQNSNEYVPVKDIQEMTEDEKKVHKEILRKKLREKRNSMAQTRTGGKQAQKSSMTSLQDMLSKIDLNQLNNHAEQVAQAAVTNTDTNTDTITSNFLEKPKEESLDDFLTKHDD